LYCTVLKVTLRYVRHPTYLPWIFSGLPVLLSLFLSLCKDGWEEHGVARGMDDVGTCTCTFAIDEVWDVGSHVHRSIAITIISSSTSFLQDAKDLA
jgi:hypothetical protein